MNIIECTCIVRYDLDESIILSLGPDLKKLQKKMGGQILSLNTPDDAPPPLPRLVLSSGDSVLKISLDRLDISIRPPDHIKTDVKKTSKYMFQKVGSMLELIVDELPEYKWSGVVFGINYPSDIEHYKSGIQAAKPIFNKIINIGCDTNELSAFQLNLGFKEEPYLINYTVSGYESRDINIANYKPKKGFIAISKEKIPISACGVRVVIDINNQPNGVTNNMISDIEMLLDRINLKSSTLSQDLNIEGII